jgi:hypothetical protein
MRRTSAADLLARAEQLTRTLCASNDRVDQAAWDRFDVTLYRAVNELVGAGRPDRGYPGRARNPLLLTLAAYPAPLNIPADSLYSVEHAAALLELPRRQMEREIRTGALRLVPGSDPRLLPASTLQRRPRIEPADPTDPHPLARLSSTLGAFADLLSENNRSIHAVAWEAPVVTGTVRRVLSVGAVAARHVVAHTAIDAVDRPLRIARYATTYADGLDPSSRRAVPLDQVVAISSGSGRASINERLEVAIHTWGRAAHLEVERLVPSTEALASVASQGVRLYAVTHHLLGSTAHKELASNFAGTEAQLRQGGGTLRDAERVLRGITSLTAPSHDYVTAARELFTTLQEVRELAAGHQAGVDQGDTLALLARGCTIHAQVLAAARAVPASLLHCHLLFAPARSLQPTLARLNVRSRGKFVPVTLADAPELGWRWDKAAATAPAVAATLHQLIAGRDVPENDRHLELGL